MPLPVTFQDFSQSRDTAKLMLANAAKEPDIQRQANMALMAQACAQIALAEATWLLRLEKS